MPGTRVFDFYHNRKSRAVSELSFNIFKDFFAWSQKCSVCAFWICYLNKLFRIYSDSNYLTLSIVSANKYIFLMWVCKNEDILLLIHLYRWNKNNDESKILNKSIKYDIHLFEW